MRDLILWTDSDYHNLKRAVEEPLDRLDAGATSVEFDGTLVIPDGELVLAMGSDPLKVLKASRAVPGNKGIQGLRGQVFKNEDTDGAWMITYDPRLVEREYDKLPEIQWDVQLACRYLHSGSLEPPRIETIEWAEDFTEIIQEIQETFENTGKKVRVTEDLETLGLWPWYKDAWIISISFTVWPSGLTRVVAFPELGQKPGKRLMEQIRWIENADVVKLTGANLKFDNIWKRVKWKLPSPKSFTTDTMISGSLVNENRKNSLNVQAKVYTIHGGYDDSWNARVDKSRMDLALARDPDGFLAYAGGDTYVDAEVAEEIIKELARDEWLADFYTTILHPAARAFEAVEYRGVRVDARKLRAVGDEAAQEIADIEKQMVAMVPRKVRYKYGEDFAFSKPKCMRDMFFSAAGWGLVPLEFTDKAPKAARKAKDPNWASTSVDKHLKRFRDDKRVAPFIGLLQKRGKAKKVLTTYVGVEGSGKGFLPHLRPDGRFHGTYALGRGSLFDQVRDQDETSGANTGRTSLKDPALQTIPKRGPWAKKLRRCYPAPKGKLWFNNDFSQGELRIAACFSNDPTMIQAYKDGMDLHLLTGCSLYGITYEAGQVLEESDHDLYERIRYGAKGNNFGRIYKQSPRGFVDYAFREWDIVMTLDESERQHEVFFDTYYMLPEWHRAQIEFARKNGYVRHPLGRVRHLPLIHSSDSYTKGREERRAINSPVQGLLSDMGLWSIAIAELERDLPQRGLEIVLFTHDAVSGYVPDTSAGIDLVRELGQVMETLPYKEEFGWDPPLDFPVDMEMGPTLGNLDKLH